MRGLQRMPTIIHDDIIHANREELEMGFRISVW
jgi:hypothetical protein